MTAKATLGLLDHGGDPAPIVATALEFGTTYRSEGWGSGLTVLVAMANVVDRLDPADRALALVHALAFVSRDTSGHAPRFAEAPLATAELPPERLSGWYRRFVDTRSADAAERVLATAAATGRRRRRRGDDVRRRHRPRVHRRGPHPRLHQQGVRGPRARRGERTATGPPASCPPSSARRAPPTAPRSRPSGVIRATSPRSPPTPRRSSTPRSRRAGRRTTTLHRRRHVGRLAWAILADDPDAVVQAVLDAVAAGAAPEQLGRALAYAAALRITRFHVQNDFGDWNTVHHAFTTANGLHQALVRIPTPELAPAA